MAEMATLELLDSRTRGTHNDLGKVEQQLAELQSKHRKLLERHEQLDAFTKMLRGSVEEMLKCQESMLVWMKSVSAD